MEEQTQHNQVPFTPAEIVPNNGLRIPLTKDSAKELFAKLFEGSDNEKNITTLSNKLKKLSVTSVDDKANYKEIKEIKNKLTKIETAIEAERKRLKEPSLEEGRAVDSMADEFFKKVSPQKELAVKKIKDADELFKAAEEKEAREKEERKQVRIKELESNGCPFTGQWWSINDISLGVQQIEESTEEQWSDMIAKVKVQNEKNIQEATAKKEKEEADRLEQERITKEQKEKQDALDAKEKEINDKLAKIEASEKVEKERKEREEKEKKDADEKLEREAIMKVERLLLAEKSGRFELLGYKFNLKDEYWNIEIGEHKRTISKEEMLQSNDEFYEACRMDVDRWNKDVRFERRKKEMIEMGFVYADGVDYNFQLKDVWSCPHEQVDNYSDEEFVEYKKDIVEAINKKKVIDDRFAKRRVQLLELGFFIEPIGSLKIEISKSESIGILEAGVRDLDDDKFSSFVSDVQSKIDKESDKKRKALQSDTDNFNEWIANLLAVPVPNIKDENLKFEIDKITKLLVKQ